MTCIAYDTASIGLLLVLYADEVVDGSRGWEGGRGLYVDLAVATPASVVVHSSHNCFFAQMKAVHSWRGRVHPLTGCTSRARRNAGMRGARAG